LFSFFVPDACFFFRFCPSPHRPPFSPRIVPPSFSRFLAGLLGSILLFPLLSPRGFFFSTKRPSEKLTDQPWWLAFRFFLRGLGLWGPDILVSFLIPKPIVTWFFNLHFHPSLWREVSGLFPGRIEMSLGVYYRLSMFFSLMIIELPAFCFFCPLSFFLRLLSAAPFACRLVPRASPYLILSTFLVFFGVRRRIPLRIQNIATLSEGVPLRPPF